MTKRSGESLGRVDPLPSASTDNDMNLAFLKSRSERISETALQIITRNGVTRQALSDIGVHLATFGMGLNFSLENQSEIILDVEDDGTFELLIFNLSEHRPPYCEGLAFDTWAVHTPLAGRFRASLNGSSPVFVKQGESLEVLPGETAKLVAMDEKVEICSLFGIARKYLPPARTSVA